MLSNYGYNTDFFGTPCNTKQLVYSVTNENCDTLPKQFKIITYNIWGLFHPKDKERDDFVLKIMEIRMKEVATIISNLDADIVCLQEMTNESLYFLTKYLHDKDKYPYKYEIDFDIKRDKNIRKRTVELYYMSKYKPNDVKIYSVPGNIGYDNSFMIIEYTDLTIINCYMQAGSKYSPGQEKYWFHYAKCREEEYTVIMNILKNYKKSIIWLGDFNTNLDGTLIEWPENSILRENNLCDAWLILNSLNENPGYTEDTATNVMRWNIKFMEKKFRYDGILYKGDLIPKNISIIGNKEIILDKELSDEFYKHLVPNVHDKDTKIKYADDIQKLFALFPSDHFGIICTFDLLS